MTDAAAAPTVSVRQVGTCDLAELGRRLGALFGEREALVHGTVRLSFAAFHARCERVAAALAQAGVQRGDRVAAWLRDGIPMAELLFATARLGAIIVPLNWRLAAAELGYIITDAAPKLLFVNDAFHALALEAAPQQALVTVSDEAPLTAGAYATFVSADAPVPARQEALADIPWLLLYTSGTTGKPKGCLLAQSGWVQQAVHMGHRLGLTPDDCFVLTAPLFHSAGTGQLLAHLSAGCRVVLPSRQADAAEMLALWVREGCTHVSPPPTLYEPLLALQRRAPRPLRIRLFTMAASMNPPTLVQQVMDVFKTRTLHGFGQTEISGFAAFLFGDEQVQRPSALGRPMLCVESRAVDDAGRELPPDTPGELVLRGPSVMLGYWGLPEATASTLAGGWLHTGDIVRVDAEGFWHFISRKKELVKTLGENVYPAEVEHRLMNHPAVLECAVFGVPDAKYVEAVKAAIVLRAGHTLDAAGVSAWCREALAGYKRPRYVEFMTELPRSPIGKIHTALLKQRPTTPEQAAP